jgi:hypothetical protein
MTVNDHSKDIDIAPDGTVLEIEEEVELSSISEQILDSSRLYS